MNLDDDLAVWAATARLPSPTPPRSSGGSSPAPARAATRRPPPPRRPAPQPSPSWWRGFNAGFTTRMVASTAPVRLAA